MRSPDADGSHRRLRTLWLALLWDLLAMAMLAVVLPILLPHRLAMDWRALATPADLFLSLAVLLLVPLGYFIRMSIFKRHWVGSQITWRGYANGQRAAMLLIWLSGFLFVVMLMRTARHGPATLGTIVAVIALCINRPQRLAS